MLPSSLNIMRAELPAVAASDAKRRPTACGLDIPDHCDYVVASDANLRGFIYLAVVLDWFSPRVLSWRLSITMEAACRSVARCCRAYSAPGGNSPPVHSRAVFI
jgi:hypothetical protein